MFFAHEGVQDEHIDDEYLKSISRPGNHTPGSTPWRVFCGAALMLVVLWWVSGCVPLLETYGYQGLQLYPLAHPVHGHYAGDSSSLSLASSSASTPPSLVQLGA